jgi:Bacterial Ig domain
MRGVRRRRLSSSVTAALLLVLVAPVSVASAGSPPAPTVAVTSPVAGAEVAGFVTVTGSATVDASDSETAQSIQFYVDGGYVSAQPCPGTKSCTADFSWDTTSLYGSHALQVKLLTSGGPTPLSPAVTVAVGDPPAAYITSPVGGRTVIGVVTVIGGGTVDALQPDSVDALKLLVDGSSVASTACVTAEPTLCQGVLSWDSTGLTGQHQVQLELVTTHGQTGLSAAVTLTAVNPAPTVVLTSPKADATVSGLVAVATKATVDASQTDAAKSVQLLVDGATVASSPCVADKSCPATISWDSRGLAGRHTLQTFFTTTGGRTATSGLINVWVFSASQVSLVGPATVPAGKTATVTGRVTAADGSGTAGLKVHVTVRNSLGRTGKDVTVATGPSGGFAVSYTSVSNTVISATVAATAHYGTSSAAVTAAVLAAPTCTLKTSIKHGAVDQLACKLGAVSNGTAISLQVRQGGSWRTVVGARTAGSTWKYGQVFAKKGTFSVRVQLSASKDFGSAATPVLKVKVS